MSVHVPARRRLLAASAAALLPMQRALAHTRSAGGDWLEMIKAHHTMIAGAFEGLLQGGQEPGPLRQRLARTLAYQLVAHAQAEENAIYPALALHGLSGEAERLVVDQSHARAKCTELQMLATSRREDPAWAEKVQALRAAVLRHARQDEEDGAYPKLQQKLDAHQNAALAEAYQREFSSVRGRS